MVYKSGPTFLSFVTKHEFDRQTDGQTELSSLDSVCIACTAVKMTTNVSQQIIRFD